MEGRITAFNRQVLQDPNVFYRPRYKGAFLVLDRCDYGRVGPICRLQYTGTIDQWEFAIFKYSDERYDPDEWLFPGVRACGRHDRRRDARRHACRRTSAGPI